MKVSYLFIILVLFLITVTILVQSGRFILERHEGRTLRTQEERALRENPSQGEAYFAGGCFWCMEADFEKVHGVSEVLSGFMGGSEKAPTYEDVALGKTGHRETVKVVYDPALVSYEELVRFFFRHVDPTDAGGSFYDRGRQYTSAIYYRNEQEKNVAEMVLRQIDAAGVFKKEIVTAVEKASGFWVAPEYHQDFYKDSAQRYDHYRKASGRDAFILNAWGSTCPTGTCPILVSNLVSKNVETLPKNHWQSYMKKSDQELRDELTPIQYEVTQRDGTEAPFDNLYDKEGRDGLYVDIVSGEPLFSSRDKYDSGTGWPSFTRPLSEDSVVLKKDYGLHLPRVEVRSSIGDSHLGHVFDDGPTDASSVPASEATGKRYCMNSAALRFVPVADMEREGYGDYLHLFE